MLRLHRKHCEKTVLDETGSTNSHLRMTWPCWSAGKGLEGAALEETQERFASSECVSQSDGIVAVSLGIYYRRDAVYHTGVEINLIKIKKNETDLKAMDNPDDVSHCFIFFAERAYACINASNLFQIHHPALQEGAQ